MSMQQCEIRGSDSLEHCTVSKQYEFSDSHHLISVRKRGLCICIKEKDQYICMKSD